MCDRRWKGEKALLGGEVKSDAAWMDGNGRNRTNHCGLALSSLAMVPSKSGGFCWPLSPLPAPHACPGRAAGLESRGGSELRAACMPGRRDDRHPSRSAGDGPKLTPPETKARRASDTHTHCLSCRGKNLVPKAGNFTVLLLPTGLSSVCVAVCLSLCACSMR
jgi:hypothetical protein